MKGIKNIKIDKIFLLFIKIYLYKFDFK